MHRTAPLGWHQSFLRQQETHGGRKLTGAVDPRIDKSPTVALEDYQMQLMLLEQQNKMRLLMARQKTSLATGSASEQKAREDSVQSEELAFSQAFAHAQSQFEEHLVGEKLSDEQSRLNDEELEIQVQSERTAEESKQQVETSNGTGDADELAKTAGDLLDKVKGDTSKKFQESNFLSLMKQLRDREVVVSGDKIVDVSHQHTVSLHA